MAKLPRITGKEAVRTFEKAGFALARTSSSHHILKKPGHVGTLSIPVHGSEIVGTGLLRAQIAVAGLSVDEFVKLLES